MRTIGGTLVPGLLMLLLCASAIPQITAGRSGGVISSAPGPWKQLAKLTEASGKEQDWLGWSVAVSRDGSTVAVGAVGWCPLTHADGCGQGAIFVFVKPASGWGDMTETAMLTASDGQPGDYLGESVAISDDGSTIVAGAPGRPGNKHENGAAYVFLRPEGGWATTTETAEVTSTDGLDLGDAVALSGNTIVAGAQYTNGLQGAAYVFVQPKGGWRNMTQTARLTASEGTGGGVGQSVSASGSTVVAGSPGNAALLFTNPKGGWKNETENAELTASDNQAKFDFGYSVSVNGEAVAVGAPNRDHNGGVYVYVRPADGWKSMTETALLTVHGRSTGLGYSVSLDSGGKSLVVGMPGWQAGGGQGEVALFKQPQSGWLTTSSPNATMKANDGRNLDCLGCSVAASPTAIAAGAPYATIGSNLQQGAAYVFGN